MSASFTNSLLRHLLALAMLISADAAWGKPSTAFDDHYTLAGRYYEAKDYDKAIAELNAAYQIDPLPALLINIGRCHFQADRPREALAVYQRVLDMKLDQDQRVELSKSIDRATIRLTEKQQAAQNAAADQQQRLIQNTLAETRLAQPPATPIYKKGWFWGIIGGTIAAGLSLGLGLGLGLRNSGQPAGPGSMDNIF